MTDKNKTEFKHLLAADKDLQKRIEAAQKKYRPYNKSRNSFMCELIDLGIVKLKELG